MDVSPELRKVLDSVTGKRARIVIDHILRYGHITTEELTKTYGYQHPPRAARDVRDHGVPLETFSVQSSDGRRIGAYRFGEMRSIDSDRYAGRAALPKKLKDRLSIEQGSVCAICRTEMDVRYLQIDHRVPYAVAGEVQFDPTDVQVREFMLLCGSCNRNKSWSCEHCENFEGLSDETVCQCCYWASPDAYSHIALVEARRLSITWGGGDVEMYDVLRAAAEEAGMELADYAKSIIKASIQREDIG